jgi:GrpB-like predicted nucleotidyltransferase (UPF0157 family)
MDEARTLRVVEHDPAWSFRFAELKTELAAALAGVAAEIEHVGSTAVPGLAARPVIDIDVIVADESKVPVVTERLEAAGYTSRGNLGIPGPEAFRPPPDGPLHHVYIVVAGSTAHVDHVGFRDLLRRRGDLAARYAERKWANADRLADDPAGYTDAKADLISELLATARAEAGQPDDPDAVDDDGVTYRWRESPLDEGEVGGLHAEAFGADPPYRWWQVRPRSLGWVTAREDRRLVGFVNVAWDGDRHAFLLETAVAADRRHGGIGRHLVGRAVAEAGRAGCEWVHVDFDPELADLYAACGFTPTTAGLRRLR